MDAVVHFILSLTGYQVNEMKLVDDEMRKNSRSITDFKTFVASLDTQELQRTRRIYR